MEDPIEICKAIVSPNLNFEKRDSFWNQLRPWLATKGYALYNYDEDNNIWYPQHYVDLKPDLFFPEVGGDDTDNSSNRPLETEFYGRVGFAQNSTFRHCALKLMEADSDEHKILTFLHKNKEDAISNCILPVVDFLETANYVFAIMPRWGIAPHFPWFSTVREAATFIHHILKAYSFLHKNHIVYQTISLESNQIKYALCDFDSSLMLSPPPAEKPIRLPAGFSWVIISQSKPNDTKQGEPDYDPFAFDIGLLGIVLWGLFSSNVHDFPLIVPLVDRMITGKLEERFSATEALKFVEDHILGNSYELLKQPLGPRDYEIFTSWCPDIHDKWTNLPADFVEKWGRYKAPKSSCSDLILRQICSKIYKGYEIVNFFHSLRHKR